MRARVRGPAARRGRLQRSARDRSLAQRARAARAEAPRALPRVRRGLRRPRGAGGQGVQRRAHENARASRPQPVEAPKRRPLGPVRSAAAPLARRDRSRADPLGRGAAARRAVAAAAAAERVFARTEQPGLPVHGRRKRDVRGRQPIRPVRLPPKHPAGTEVPAPHPPAARRPHDSSTATWRNREHRCYNSRPSERVNQPRGGV